MLLVPYGVHPPVRVTVTAPHHVICVLSVEKENDLLVCGDCQTSFALQDIVLFIKHKKQCCDKENVDTADGPCRKPGSGGGINNNEHNGDHIDDDDPDEDNDDEGVDVSKSSSRRGEDEEEEDEASEDNNKEENGEEDSMDTSGHNSLVNGEAVERHEQRRRREDRTSRTPLRQKQVADAESNTIHSGKLFFTLLNIHRHNIFHSTFPTEISFYNLFSIRS